MRMYGKISALLCAIIIALSSMGVVATWMYVTSFPDPVSANAQIGLWTPNYPEIGESHTELIDALLNGNSSITGLNDPNSTLAKAVVARDNGGRVNNATIDGGRNTVGSMAELFKDIFTAYGTGTAQLAFLVYFPDGAESDTFKIYTWSTADGNLPLSITGKTVTTSDVTMGNWRTGNWTNYKYTPESAPTKTVWVHPIYETTIVKKDGVWQVEGSAVQGYAQACYYTENRNNAVFSTMHGSKLLSIYPPSFTTVNPVG